MGAFSSASKEQQSLGTTKDQSILEWSVDYLECGNRNGQNKGMIARSKHQIAGAKRREENKKARVKFISWKP